MKKIILLLCLILSLTVIVLPGHAQDHSDHTVENRIFNLDSATRKPKTEAELVKNSTKTTNKAIYKGHTYPVYYSNTGKVFIIVKAQSGNLYRKYIKV